jgi:hypothetical protein
MLYTTLASKTAKKGVRKAAFPLSGARRVSAA